MAAGLIRDGHGDLLADVAFLAIDLERLGAPELAVRFLDWYGEFSGRSHPATLAEHYVAYRAHVRAKVACLRNGQGDASAAGEAAALLAQAVRHLERGGCGWCWSVAGRGRARRRWRRRWRTPPGGACCARTRCGAPARAALRLGEPVVLDASWAARGVASARPPCRRRHGERRGRAVLRGAPRAGRRPDARRAAGAGLSDATAATAAAMAADFDPWPEAARVDTAGEEGRSLAVARAAVAAG